MTEHVARAPRRSWLLRHAPAFVAVEIALAIAVLYLLARSTIGILIGGLLLVVLILLLVPLIGGRSLLSWIRLRLAYGGRRPVPSDRVAPELAPVAEWVPQVRVAETRSGRGEEIGTISDGAAWTAVLALEADDDLIADSGAELDLAALADLTISDDIVFAGIQVVTYTVPAPTTLLLGPGSAAARAYAETVTDLPPALRRTWLCVRLDPTRCLAAVERRGTGVDGINATLRFGLHRVQSLLKRQGVDTRALSGAELAEVLAVTSGASPDPQPGGRTAEYWSHWHCDGLIHSGQAVRAWGSNPSVAYGRLLEVLGSAPVLFAVTSYTLSPGEVASGGIRLVTPTETAAEAAIAQVAGALGTEVRLRAGGGMQVPTMLATLPLGRGVEL